jgi:hypothetical protein
MAPRREAASARARAPASKGAWISGRPGLWIVLGTGLVVRLLHLADAARLPIFDRPTVDAALYVDLAQRLAASFADPEPFYKPPFYPYLLAVTWKLAGESWFVLRLPGILAGTVTCGVVWWIGRRLFGPTAGLLAGLLYALHRTAVYFEGELLEIGVVTALHTAALALVLRARPSADAPPGWRRAAAAGIALGLGTVARPTLLVFDAVALAWLGRRSALPVLAGVVLVLAPVTLHNAARGGGLVLVSSNLGVNFHLGNNPRATGRIAASDLLPANPAAAEQAARALAEQAAGGPLRASQVSRYWLRRGLEYDVSHPGHALSLLGRKIFYAWNAAEISDNEDLSGLALHLRVYRVLPVGTWLLAPLALAGLVLAPRGRDTLLLRGFVAAQIASLLPFFMVARFRLTWMPALAMFAAWTLIELVSSRRARAGGRPALAASVAAAALFCGMPAFGVRAPVDFDLEYKLGYAYLQKGKPEAALASYREAVRRNPRNALAQNALGVLLAERGEDLDGARRAIEAALELDPGREPIYAESLAGVHLRRGDAEAALQACARGLAARPDAPTRALLHLRQAEAGRLQGDRAGEAAALRAALAAALPAARAADARRRLAAIEPDPPSPAH